MAPIMNWRWGLLPRGDDARLLAAINALWSTPALRGPWQDKEDFGQIPTLPITLEADGFDHLYGVIQLADGRELSCLSVTVREENGPDWLDICLPTGMLELVYGVRYPLTRRSNPWLDLIDEQFVAIAEHLYATIPFALASIGEEVSGASRAATLASDKLASGGVVRPPALEKRVARENKMPPRPSGLSWYPWQGDDFDHVWIPATD